MVGNERSGSSCRRFFLPSLPPIPSLSTVSQTPNPPMARASSMNSTHLFDDDQPLRNFRNNDFISNVTKAESSPSSLHQHRRTKIDEDDETNLTSCEMNVIHYKFCFYFV